MDDPTAQYDPYRNRHRETDRRAFGDGTDMSDGIATPIGTDIRDGTVSPDAGQVSSFRSSTLSSLFAQYTLSCYCLCQISLPLFLCPLPLPFLDLTLPLPLLLLSS